MMNEKTTERERRLNRIRQRMAVWFPPTGKAAEELAYIEGGEATGSDALFFAEYLVDDDSKVGPLLVSGEDDVMEGGE